MRTTQFAGFWLASLLLCGCSGPRSDAGSGTTAEYDPGYGPEVPLKGVYRSGFEVSVLHLCEESRQDCAATLTLDEEGCWLKFTDVAVAELDRRAPNLFEADEFGEAWVEGTGRIARKPGDFGHLNAYPCQVELTHLRIIDGGPPYVFRPPPP